MILTVYTVIIDAKMPSSNLVPLADESWNYHFHTICCLLWGIANRVDLPESTFSLI
jgi:hypothetical protein